MGGVGFVQPDLIVANRLRDAVALIHHDPALVTDALAAYDDDTQRQIVDVLGRRSRPLPVFRGWPMGAEQVPGIGVVLRPESEDGRQMIGTLGDEPQGDTMVTTWGTFQRATIQVAAYGTSQEGATVIALVVKWCLLNLRQAFEREDGLLEVTQALADYRPEEGTVERIENLFSRLVTLTCTYLDTWRGLSEGPLLSGVIGGAYDNREEIVL